MKLINIIVVIFIIFVALFITVFYAPKETTSIEAVADTEEFEIQSEYDKDIWIETMAYLYGVDEQVARKFMSCESNINQNARNKNYWYKHTCLETGEVTKKIYQDSKVPKGFCVDGTVVTNSKHWSTDIGIWQLNNSHQEKTALSMGLDIYDEKDNITYGFWLYSEEGATPWSASKHCHGHT